LTAFFQAPVHWRPKSIRDAAQAARDKIRPPKKKDKGKSA
jgi:hypothetical protein